jgi:hypothetical protein
LTIFKLQKSQARNKGKADQKSGKTCDGTLCVLIHFVVSGKGIKIKGMLECAHTGFARLLEEQCQEI